MYIYTKSDEKHNSSVIKMNSTVIFLFVREEDLFLHEKKSTKNHN